MIDFVLSLLSSVLHMNMRDHHDIPFALPLVMAAVTGFIIGFAILSLIGKEKPEQALQDQTEED